MRDAFGGVFMMRLFLVFIVIYVAFTAISLKYARAFRIKNSVISFIEEKQILDLNAFFANSANNGKVQKLKNIIKSADYNMQCSKGNGQISTGAGGPQAYCFEGVTIKEKEKTKTTITYTVYTYAGWNLKSLNALQILGGMKPQDSDVVNGSWKISGEAVVRIG